MKNVIIVDNAPYAFAYQLDNGYPIIPFLDDENDKELQILKTYLEELVDVNDVREKNRERFKLEWLCSLDVEDFLQYYSDNDEDIPLTKVEENLKELINSYFSY